MKSYNTKNPTFAKRFATVFIIVAMVLTTVLPAFASDDNVVSVSSITFDDGNGNIVQSLDGLDRVRAQVTVKTKTSQKMVFVLALYGKNNKLLKIDREEKSATSQGTTFQAIIEYDLPDNAEGYKLNAFLLDSVKSMDAIARGSLFPNGNLELCNLYLTIGDDEPVDLLTVEASKDGNYEIDVPLDIIYAPTVKAVAVDNGTKVEVTPPSFFPGYTDIKLTATNGATKNYRINYSAKSTIESLTGYLGTDFHAADDTEGDYGSPYWSDRTTPATTGANVAYYNDVRTISDEWDYLRGSIYYKAAVGDYVNPSYKSDRSTTVRVFGTSAITGDGWTSATNTDGHITVSHTTGAGVEGHAEYQPALKMTVASSKTFPAGKVTLPAIPKNFIVVVEPAQYVPESHRAFYVNSIEVNGDAIDTSKGPGTYNVPLASDVIYAPEITEEDVAFAEEYSNRTVEITNPTSFPGQSVIKITSGEDSVEYVINYSLDNLLTNTSDNIGTNFHAADDDNAADYSGHLRGSRFFMDRNDTVIWVNNNSSQGVAYYNDIRSINSAYDFLNGSTYFMAAVGTKPNTKFTVGRAADVYAFTIAGGTYSGAEGWTKTENSGGFMTFSSTLGQGVGTGAPGKMTVLYHKSLEAGDSVSITPSQREAIVVVKFKGYIEKGLTLTDLKVDGKTIPGFASDRNEYTVELPADTRISPKVTAEADNEQSVVEVLNPGDGDNPATFPGKAIVNVTYGNKTKQYIVNYKAKEALLTATTSNYRTGFCAADDANANVVGGVKVGSQLYADRSCPVYVANNPANGIAYYNDIRSIADDWDYLNGADYFISAIGNRTATFKLNRDAVVRVFSSGANAISETDGWKKETDASGYVISSTTTGEDAVKFTSMFYKSFKAGDTVTVNPAVKESIIVIDYLGYVDDAAMLSDLAVNGETVSGFSMMKTDYTVEIAPDTLLAPMVTATALTNDCDVEIINPVSFPGKAVVKVTCGDDVKEYTISYTSPELISNASRAVGKNFHAAEGDGLGSQLFSDRGCPAPAIGGGVAYYNDIRAISDDWKYLTGTDYFMSAVGARNVTFTLNRAAVVRVFSDGTNAVSGWDKATLSDGYYMAASTTTGQFTEEGSTKFNTMFYKKYYAGDTVTLSPAVMTSVIVIDYDGYMEGAAALLSGIEVNGEALEGFDMTKTEYNVEIDSATLVLPEVTATALSDNAVVEVINPGEGDNPNVFPGKVIINVTEGDTENQYIVNYVAGDLISDNTKTVGKDFHAADDANAVEVGGYKVGSPLFSDRATPVTNAAGLAYFNDIRTIADDWDYLNGADYFSSAVGARSVTFTLNRAAVVRVFSWGTNAMSTDDGWTRETDSNGYMTASVTSGQGITTDNAVFSNMFYKKFSAGDTVTVSPTVKESITVIDYLGYVNTVGVLTEISIDGESIPDFDSENYEYDVDIAPDTVVLPEITATALSDNAIVEVINPGEGDNPNVFPGKVIINVTEGDVENEYIINYTYEPLTAIANMSSSNGGSFFGSNFHEPGDFGETYGSRLFYDRTAVPAYSGSTLAYYNDVREICDEMDYLKGTDYIMANRNLGANVTHTFTLLRPATIRVFHLTGYAAGNATLADWTTVVNDTAYIRTSHTTGSGVEGHAAYRETLGYGSMTYKEFAAGDEVSVASPGDHAIVVIDYAGYEIN